MRKYLYNYQTIIRFSSPVSRHFFRLRCIPCTNDFQNVEKQDLYLYPSDYLSHDTDAWGNLIQYGSRIDQHDSFVFASSGEVNMAPYFIPADTAVELFTLPSALTGFSPSMECLLAGFPASGGTLDQALALSQSVHQYMHYVSHSTFTTTTAAQAFEQQQGVCQDYAHILISLCRNYGIAARYVNGFLQGIGETHAWVEIHDGKGWHGIDPTNNQLIEYGYIKLAHGRDAADCSVNRGVFTGTATQQVEIRVIVEEI